MLTHIILPRTLWALIGVLTLVAAATGLWQPSVYHRIVSEDLLPGAFSQDVLSIAAALCLLYLALTARSERVKRQIIGLGLLGYLFYAYGIYVIERAYNGLYLVYMAIFALAFWALVLAGAHLHRGLGTPSLPKKLRLVSASGAMLHHARLYDPLGPDL